MKKAKRNSTQELMGVKAFTDYGIQAGKEELLLFLIAPTNLSVLSSESIEVKIRNLIRLLSIRPNMEICCTDSSECFDDNKLYLKKRLSQEKNQQVQNLLQKDLEFLDSIQIEMSSARQFLFVVRCRDLKPEQVFAEAGQIEKKISDLGFEVHRMKKPEIKRFLAIWFGASLYGEQMPDVDGSQYFDMEKELNS